MRSESVMTDTALRAKLRCSFCGNPSTDVDKLVAGPGVYICNGCAATAHAIMTECHEQPPPLRLPMWESMSDEQMLDHIPRVAAVADQVETDLRTWVQELRRRRVT